VAEQLLSLSYEVIVLDNLTTGRRENVPEGVEFFPGDVRDRDTVSLLARGCDVIFHLAASVGNARSIANPIEDASINVLGTLNVLEGARLNGIGKVVYSSSAGIFGEVTNVPVGEGHPQNPITPYGVSKLAGEKLCLAYNTLHQMRNVCLRYFNVFGPRQYFDAYGNVIPIFVRRALRGEPLVIFGTGEQTRDFVDVRDVATANIAAMVRYESSGTFNIGSGARTSVSSLAEAVIALCGGNVGIERGPARKGDVMHSVACIAAAESVLGYKPAISLTEGLAEYVAWFRRSGDVQVAGDTLSHSL
jgi:UDP-glucose 4-epimerase